MFNTLNKAKNENLGVLKNVTCKKIEALKMENNNQKNAKKLQ